MKKIILKKREKTLSKIEWFVIFSFLSMVVSIIIISGFS
ncbi:MAG: hypothetical protein KR126chlam4_00722 [Candidatus Anoxychlamydiales bacterium]|nr:hypothetical protein [Candidatus Anoxychlamydiales bacterium]NGX40891.1 hypothetical protein [Candidatus Anoxychlamydiales bacterium]